MVSSTNCQTLHNIQFRMRFPFPTIGLLVGTYIIHLSQSHVDIPIFAHGML